MAKIVFSATAGLYTQFLNFIKENEVFLSNIEYNHLGFTAVCDSEDYFFISKNSKKFQTKVRIIRKKGIYFKIRKITRRKGIFASAILFYALVFLYSNLIWNVNIKTNDKDLKNTVACQLFSNGIYAGSVYNEDKLNNAIKNIMLENPHLGYITLNFYKGILDCNVYERINKEDYVSDLTGDNIYASKSGIITDIRVYDGFSQVQLGQSVSVGDILVSNTYTDRHGNIFTGNTRAFITAECDHQYRIFVPFEKNIPLLTGESATDISVYFCGKEFVLAKSDLSRWQGSMKKVNIEYFSFMGFRFPFTLKKVVNYRTQQTVITKDISLALNYGKLQLHHIIENDVELKKEYNRQFSYKPHQDGLEVVCHIRGIYEIT